MTNTSNMQQNNQSVQANHARQIIPRVAAMHGGLSPYIEGSFEGILAINRHKDIENGALADLTWSDPTVDVQSFSDNCTS